MSLAQELERIVVVLHEPRDPVNIGGVVRAMTNMGLSRLRLVRPVEFDPYRIEGVAKAGRDILRDVRFFDGLADAVADCRLVVGTSARGRRVRRAYRRPREAAREILEVARSGGDVGLVFGREDRGLSNRDLDLCDRLVVIPTSPENPSLNLAQAVLVLAYETFVASGAEVEFKEPRRAVLPAPVAAREELVREVRETLQWIDFFKAHKVTPIMRTVREVAGRADLDRREVALFKAMAIEVRKYMVRQGLEPATSDAGDADPAQPSED